MKRHDKKRKRKSTNRTRCKHYEKQRKRENKPNV